MKKEKNRYRDFSDTEIKLERIYSIFVDVVIYALTLGIIVGGYLLLTSVEVHAMGLKTTLTSNPQIEEMIQKRKGYNTYEIADYIASHEGFSEIPFKDSSGIGKVIGFGFQPRGRTYMTKKEGIAILNAEVERLIPKITDVYGFVPQNKMTALVSILYNTPTYAKVIKDKDIIEALKENDLKEAKKYLLNHSLRGIRERRAEELALYFNDTI